VSLTSQPYLCYCSISLFPLSLESQWDAHDGGSGGGTIDDEITASARSYEELVRTHVDAYVAASDSYGSESRLSRRVAEWQTRLQPTLDEEDARPTFDIQLYGQRVYVV
jgi:hypothetical protein